jgi:hypothetical protein
MDTKIIRIFNTYGPRMRLHDGRAIPEFLSQALTGKPLTVFGDGQARVVPITFLWPGHFRDGSDMYNAQVATNRAIGACGVDKLLEDGNPRYSPSFDALAWTRKHHGKGLEALYSWNALEVGVSKNSLDTGDQEDQAFVGGEARLQPNSVFRSWRRSVSRGAIRRTRGRRWRG